MIAWIAAGAGVVGLVLSLLVYFYRRLYLAAEDEGARLRADVAAAQTAAAEERERQEVVIHVSDDLFRVYQDNVEAMVARHPDLAREYGAVVRRFAAAAGHPYAAVPGPTATGVPGGGARGGD